MDRKIILAITDTHGGSSVGLCNPDTILKRPNGDINPALSESQKFLWEVYEWGIRETFKLAGDDEVLVIHDGDITQGIVFNEESLTNAIADQIQIAFANFQPIMSRDNVKHLRIVTGTPVHEMGENSAPILLSEMMKLKYPDVDIRLVNHELINYGGIDIDVAHHGASRGYRVWLEGNQLRFYLRNIMFNEILAGNKPPELVLRGHYHTYRVEYLEMMDNKSWIILLPSLTLMDNYSRKVTRSEYRNEIGVVAIEIINNRIHDIHPFIKRIDLRVKETL